MINDIAIAWLDGLRTDIKEEELREALLIGINAIEKLEKIEQIMNPSIEKDPSFRLAEIAMVLTGEEE